MVPEKGGSSKIGQVVNKARLAKIFGVSTTAVDAWIRSGCPVLEQGGLNKPYRFDTAAVARWKVQRAKDELLEQSGGMSSKEAQERKLKAEAELAEIELAKTKGELVAADEVALEAFNRARQIRDSLMSTADRLGAELAVETDPGKIKARIEQEIRAALAELTADFPDDEEDMEG